MKLRAFATAQQGLASNPGASSWVVASAGAGKTQVLTDRVLRLLLAGSTPGAILCLTFTRAAAAEMRVRITDSLGEWATAADAELAENLRRLAGEAALPLPGQVRRARQLFATVLDAPGGLKVQTIHAFCESILARFPVESGVASHFQVLDERTATEMLEKSRDDVLVRARGDEILGGRLSGITARVNELQALTLMMELAKQRSRLGVLLAQGCDSAVARVRAHLGIAQGETPDSILAKACAAGSFDAVGLEGLGSELRKGAPTFAARGSALLEWLHAPAAARAATFVAYRALYVTDDGDGEPRKDIVSKKVVKDRPDLVGVIEAEVRRLDKISDRLHKAEVFDATSALLAFADALLDRYKANKARNALLDYDDLILKTSELLRRPGVAPWVLYKLDGGIEHILVDEAQDTSPEQWKVIRAIADEFFSGLGAHESRAGRAGKSPAGPRTVFAVGDPKQSVFGFLQAEPQSFASMREYFDARVRAAERDWHPVALNQSFRSVDPVLDAVDAVFAGAAAQAGLLIAEPEVRHTVHRQGQAGFVEVWPTEKAVKGDELPDAWTPALEQEHRSSPSARLAERIAATVHQWVGRDMLHSRDRTVRPGDIMVLVQRRTAFVEEVVRALKLRNIAVAGTDRMVITEQLPVQDLMALGRFVLLPEDDLNLATVLKGPFVGLSEDLLFALAYGRRGRLWTELRARSGENPAFASALAFLDGTRAAADVAAPHTFYARVLAEGGRTRILSRLGHEAMDPVDEFLSRALEFERAHPPSLQGFLHWIERGMTEVKRDLEVGRNEVRVLTVHGAKGLQSPVVFLADTCRVPMQDELFYWDNVKDGPALLLWPHRKKNDDAVVAALRAQSRTRRDHEHHRLLYVAMTRAEDRLIVCGFETKVGRSKDSWYSLIEDGVARMRTRPASFADGVVRWECPQTEVPDRIAAAAAAAAKRAPLPAWAHRMAPAEPAAKTPLSPSRPLGTEPPVLSPLGDERAAAGIRRGVLIHRLLQLLPNVTGDGRAVAARRFLDANAAEFTAAEREEMAAATLGVLRDPRLAHMFGPGSRAEVPVVGVVRTAADHAGGRAVLSGQIDRLVVGEREVWIVDYKTHRPAPASAVAVPAMYVRQMAAYRAVVSAIYPGRLVRCALLWTDGPTWMELSGETLGAVPTIIGNPPDSVGVGNLGTTP